MEHVETVVNASTTWAWVWDWSRRRRAGRPAGLTGPGLVGRAHWGRGRVGEVDACLGGGKPDRIPAGRSMDASCRRKWYPRCYFLPLVLFAVEAAAEVL